MLSGGANECKENDADLDGDAGDEGHEGVEFDELQVNGKQERPA